MRACRKNQINCQKIYIPQERQGAESGNIVFLQRRYDKFADSINPFRVQTETMANKKSKFQRDLKSPNTKTEHDCSCRRDRLEKTSLALSAKLSKLSRRQLSRPGEHNLSKDLKTTHSISVSSLRQTFSRRWNFN
ncbi:hypothetical protein J6590_035656 [Homalodisca vitripennis]|nr:hypothetical protein J6590_035656 [Homalodisca vitripennis]